MITIRTNIGSFVNVIIKNLENLADSDKLTRTMATTALAMMKVRIHKNGLNAENKPIGIYSKGYMVTRTGQYENNKKTKGADKGGFKVGKAGIFTKKGSTVFTQVDEETVTSKKGFVKISFLKKERPRYNRDTDPKVIASLTRQMENDEKVVAVKAGVYGIGFTNSHNFDKSQWVEATYKQQIFYLSPDEIQAVTDIANKFVKDALS